jgi:hypothetical protein
MRGDKRVCYRKEIEMVGAVGDDRQELSRIADGEKKLGWKTVARYCKDSGVAMMAAVAEDGGGGRQTTTAADKDSMWDWVADYNGEGQERAARDGGESGVSMMAAAAEKGGGRRQRRKTAAADIDGKGGQWRQWTTTAHGIWRGNMTGKDKSGRQEKAETVEWQWWLRQRKTALADNDSSSGWRQQSQMLTAVDDDNGRQWQYTKLGRSYEGDGQERAANNNGIRNKDKEARQAAELWKNKEIKFTQKDIFSAMRSVRFRVVHRGVTGSLAENSKLPILAGRYFGQYFFGWNYLWISWNPLTLILKRGLSPSKRGPMSPILGKKGVAAKILIPKFTNGVFLWYWYAKYQENTDRYRPKIPNGYTILVHLKFLLQPKQPMLHFRFTSLKYLGAISKHREV